MAGALENAGYDVVTMTDESPDASLRPTRQNLDDQLWRICKRASQPDDTLLVFFAGHADVVGEHPCLIPVDYTPGSRAITMGSILEALTGAPCRATRKLMVLDACHSADGASGVRISRAFNGSLSAPSSVIVMAGCAAGQLSYEDEELGHGRLTAAILKGLAGDAYAQGEEFLLGSQLWEFVREEFHRTGWVRTQRPQLFGRWDAGTRFDLTRRDIEAPVVTSQDLKAAELILDNGFEAFAEADWHEAIGCAKTALKLAPSHVDARALRAWCYEHLGFRSKALEDATLVLGVAPSHPGAHMVSATIQHAHGSAALALEHLRACEAALAREPGRWSFLDSPLDSGMRWFLARSLEDALYWEYGGVLEKSMFRMARENAETIAARQGGDAGGSTREVVSFLRRLNSMPPDDAGSDRVQIRITLESGDRAPREIDEALALVYGTESSSEPRADRLSVRIDNCSDQAIAITSIWFDSHHRVEPTNISNDGRAAVVLAGESLDFEPAELNSQTIGPEHLVFVYAPLEGHLPAAQSTTRPEVSRDPAIARAGEIVLRSSLARWTGRPLPRESDSETFDLAYPEPFPWDEDAAQRDAFAIAKALRRGGPYASENFEWSSRGIGELRVQSQAFLTLPSSMARGSTEGSTLKVGR